MGYGRCQVSGVAAAAYTLIILIGSSSCLKIVGVTIPNLADLRYPVLLDCIYDEEQDALFSAKWYIGNKEFYRYMPSHKPSWMIFNVSTFKVDEGECNMVHCQVKLTQLQTTATAAYTCEVSSEAPKFRTVTETRNMTIAVLPSEAPRIEGLKTSYDIGDPLDVTCRTSPSLPISKISLLINNQQVENKFVTRFVDPIDYLFSSSARIQLMLTRNHFVPADGDGNVSIIKVTCTSHLEGIPSSMGKTEATASLAGPTLLTNQKLEWPVLTNGSLEYHRLTLMSKIIIGISLLLLITKIK